jgi:hypothetical protein
MLLTLTAKGLENKGSKFLTSCILNWALLSSAPLRKQFVNPGPNTLRAKGQRFKSFSNLQPYKHCHLPYPAKMLLAPRAKGLENKGSKVLASCTLIFALTHCDGASQCSSELLVRLKAKIKGSKI